MDLLLSLKKALTLWPDREALVQGDLTRLTYRKLGERIAQLARGLADRGIERGDVVAMVAPNVHQYVETYYACAFAGAVLAPVNFRLSARELALIFESSQPKLCIAHRDFAAVVEEASLPLAGMQEPPRLVWIGEVESGHLSEGYDELLDGQSGILPSSPSCSADDLAHLYFTSGTTGKPKGVMLTHGNVSFHALSAIAELRLSDADTWLHAAPLFHLADAWATFALTWVGGRHVCLPYFDAEKALRAIQEERVTLSNLIPTMLNLMVNHPAVDSFDLSSLRVILSGGAPIAPETVRRIIAAFECDYIQTYGMTETSPYLTVSLLKEHLRDLPEEQQLAIKSRTGRPFIGVELKVVTEEGREVAHDDCEVGEILARGPTVTPGYWRDPEATAAAFDDGWLRTGDLAVVDAEGYLDIVDRKKDTIISGGENIYSTEVEYVLYEHPAVLEAAVIGVPDEVWGEAVKAVVVPRPGRSLQEREVIDFVKGRLAGFKAPKSVEIVDALPRTGSGKISKKVLRERCTESRAHPVSQS